MVQNHAPLGATIPMMALSDALTAKLSGQGFQVINPYNSVGVNQNRNVLGEKTPNVSAMELAKKLKADGAVTASVLEFREILLGSSPAEYYQYSIRITLNLADAQTGAAVCGETIKCKSLKYTKSQVAKNKQEYLGDLMFAAADECAERLKNNPNVKKWRPPPPQPKPLPPPPEPKRPMFDKIIDKLSVDMLSNSQFGKNYEEQKEKGERLPIAVIGGMENESGHPEFDAGLKAAGVASGNSATENGDLMEELKQHGSPDFFVIGNLTRFADLDGMGYYKFRVTINSLRTGKIVWEGIETITTNTETAQ